jgi:hypothetical protein
MCEKPGSHSSNMPGTGKFTGGHQRPPVYLGGHWYLVRLSERRSNDMCLRS